MLTTNVDHCFQRSGFDKRRLFYTQGDYGLFQGADPRGASAHRTYDNAEAVRRMVLAEGFAIEPDGRLSMPDGGVSMTVTSRLIPVCPDDGQTMVPNLRAGDRFVEDDGWHEAADRYASFLRAHRDRRVLRLELGAGRNTPGIIKHPFWQLTAANPRATFCCISTGVFRFPEQEAARIAVETVVACSTRTRTPACAASCSTSTATKTWRYAANCWVGGAVGRRPRCTMATGGLPCT